MAVTMFISDERIRFLLLLLGGLLIQVRHEIIRMTLPTLTTAVPVLFVVPLVLSHLQDPDP